MAMNAAQAHHVADLYGMPELMELFDLAGFGDLSRCLARIVLETDAESIARRHRSELRSVTTWAAELGLTGWFERRPDGPRPMTL